MFFLIKEMSQNISTEKTVPAQNSSLLEELPIWLLFTLH